MPRRSRSSAANGMGRPALASSSSPWRSRGWTPSWPRTSARRCGASTSSGRSPSPGSAGSAPGPSQSSRAPGHRTSTSRTSRTPWARCGSCTASPRSPAAARATAGASSPRGPWRRGSRSVSRAPWSLASWRSTPTASAWATPSSRPPRPPRAPRRSPTSSQMTGSWRTGAQGALRTPRRSLLAPCRAVRGPGAATPLAWRPGWTLAGVSWSARASPRARATWASGRCRAWRATAACPRRRTPVTVTPS
mmetsp:Transcript_92674/g.288947  ORF Transcript_92674/g.288947 Transcript_92674/m.288947 type:complete len:249 (+) Transcript_92674:431-1177(+)